MASDWSIISLYTPSANSCLCIFGLIISAYALYVETKKHANTSYEAWCDFSDNMSCSRVLTSEYSKGLGLTQYLFGKESLLNLPNCLLGMLLYLLLLVVGSLNYWWAGPILFYSSVIASIISLYLAYILFFILKDLCIVCIATYFVNFGLLYVNW